MSDYTYMLPPVNGVGEVITKTTSQNSIVIIGANGSGKSRIGAWIEKQNPEKTHRIGAQRNNTVTETVPLKSLEQALGHILYSFENVDQDPGSSYYKQRKPNFYKNGRWTSYERNDIDYVLAGVFAKRTKQLEEHDEKAKTAINQTLQRKNNIVDNIQAIWSLIYPHRNIRFIDAKIIASISSSEYNDVEMSDGERVVLYLISQALLMPENRIIIIDEPEIHLHRSIMIRLWTAIEQARPDCLFIYITHDTEFAATHRLSDKIWCKSFDGNHFDWQMIDESELPDELLLDILGNRKQVIFVEGTKDSYYTKVFENIYKDYYIIPCGSCAEVVARTKAMNNTAQLNHLKAYGIIDKDYRCDAEITSLSQSNIYVLSVAEIENLFITKEIFEIMNRYFAHTNDLAIDNAIAFVIDTKFKNMIDIQIRKATIAEYKHQLTILDISETHTETEVANTISTIGYEQLNNSLGVKYCNALNSRNYMQILALFNEKGLSKSVGHFFGCTDREYCDLIVRLISGERLAEFREALKLYLPQEIPYSIEEVAENA